MIFCKYIRKMSDLIRASRESDYDEVKRLLENGADPDLQDVYGWTALMVASRWDYEIIARLLLKHNADPDIQDNYGKTAIMEASSKGHKNIIQLLLEKGANPDIQDDEEKTAFDLAFNDEMRELLESAGLPGPKRAEK